MRSLVGVLAAMLLAACYESPKPPCMFLCGEGGACPTGYVCETGGDNRCHRDDPGGPAECPDDLPQDDDAAVFDSALLDAPPIDAEPIDAEPIDSNTVCQAALNPTSDGGAAALQDLVISEINPGDYIELYNNTGTAIALSGGTHNLLSEPNSVALATHAPTVTVPPGGYATVTWPAAFTDVDAGGEILLYIDNQFTTAASIMDFVCWGTNPHGTQKPLAETAGKWTAAAACAGVLTMSAIHQLVATDGIDPTDYDVTLAPSPSNCDPS